KYMTVLGLLTVLALMGLGCSATHSGSTGASAAALTTNGQDDDNDGTVDEADEAKLAGTGKHGDDDGDHKGGGKCECGDKADHEDGQAGRGGKDEDGGRGA